MIVILYNITNKTFFCRSFISLITFVYVLLLFFFLIQNLSFNDFLFFCTWFPITLIMNDNYSFISNNVKGIKASEKRLKLFEYIKNSIGNNGSIFFEETHLSINDEQKWKDVFKGPLSFHMAKLILVEWQLPILGQKILKWRAKPVIKMDGFRFSMLFCMTQTFY